MAVLLHFRRIRPAGLCLRHVAEQLLRALVQIVADLPADAEDHALGLVPVVDVAVERVAARVPNGFLAADDVPAERLIAVEELLVHTADEVPRRVVVHVHLLGDHAFLALDLVGVELGVPEHVHEDVERDVPRLRGALDVVARVLLARESVELAADRIDLHGDVASRRPSLRPLEEHVIREVCDAVRVESLVARSGREHDRARHRLRRVHRGRQDPQAIVETLQVEGAHRRDATEADRLGGVLQKRCNARETASVPNSIAAAGTRSSAAWTISRTGNSSGSLIGMKPYVWMPSCEKKRPSVTPPWSSGIGMPSGSSSRSTPASISKSPRSGSAGPGSCRTTATSMSSPMIPCSSAIS